MLNSAAAAGVQGELTIGGQGQGGDQPIEIQLAVAGAGAVAAGEAGEQTSFNIDKNTLAPGLQLMPANSNFEINSLTIGEFKFSEEFDIDNSQINLLEIKYKFN